LFGVRESIGRLKASGRKIILFELIYKLGATAIVYPCLLLLLELVLKASGVNYLTNEYILKILENPITWLAILLALTIFVGYCLYEMSFLLACFEADRQGLDVTLMDIAVTAFKDVRGIFGFRRIAVILYFFVSVIAVNIGITCNLILTQTTRNLLRMYVINGFWLYRWLLVIALALLFIYVIPRIFVFPVSMLTGRTIKESCRHSRRIVRKNLLKVILSLVLYNLLILLVILLFYVLITLVLIAGVKLLDMAYMGSAIYLSVLKIIRAAVKLVLVYTAVPLSFALIANMFYGLYDSDDIDFKIERFTRRTRLRSKKVYGSALFLVVALNLIYIISGFNKNPFEKVAIFHETKISAHRGASLSAPENTMAAFEEAAMNMADLIELDVQMTSDGELVVMHDSNALRTTGVDREISDMTLAEVKQLDAGSFFSKEYAGEQVPTLEEVLDFAKGRINVNVEIKSGVFGTAVADKVVELIQAKNMQEECVVTSFEIDLLQRVKELEPNIEVGYILVAAYGDFYNMDDVDFFSVNAAFLTKRMVDAIHNSGKQIHAWTVNNQSSIKNLTNKGVDNIITDDPLLARETIYSRDTSETIVNMAKYVFNR
jgi:glycerophosphoryl diester phosphodiesterase